MREAKAETGLALMVGYYKASSSDSCKLLQTKYVLVELRPYI